MSTRATFSGETRSRSLRGELAPRSVPIRALDIPVVTQLPVEPQDRDIVIYEADSTNTIRWMLQYHDKSQHPTKPWVMLGGAATFDRDVTQRDTTNTSSYVQFTNSTIDLDVPLPGDYTVVLTSQLVPPSGAGNSVVASWGGTAFTAADAYAVTVYGDAGNSATITRQDAAVLAVGNLEVQGRVNTGTGSIVRTYLGIEPIRVGRP